MKHTVLIQYDNIDKIYIASVPDLQGCMAHGVTQEEALSEVSQLYDMWIEEAMKMGKSIPAPSFAIPVV